MKTANTVRFNLDINNFKQNHPELVVSDLSSFAPEETIRHVLKFRGINKWLRVRRLLIKLKHSWKAQIHELEAKKKEAKKKRNYREYYRLKGYVEALVDHRQQVRSLCHSPRDVDFPENYNEFGNKCNLPEEFPLRPHKKWFHRYEGKSVGE